MHSEWIVNEHHRMHTVEDWPDSPAKHVTLAAIRSKLESLLRSAKPGAVIPECEVCLGRRKAAGLLEFPEVVPIDGRRSNLAA